MKILRIVLIVIAVLIAIPLVVALFVKKDYAVEREIVINKPVQEVFGYIKYLKNQDNYSRWNTMDPDMKKSFKGVDGQVGFVAAWESTDKNVGKGEQEIVAITDNQRIETILRFMEPFESEDHAYMTTTAIDSVTTHVTWGFSGKFPYPMNLMQLMMDMDEAVGSDLGVGLENLKRLMESN